MDEEKLQKYAVCKRRNVAAAYERFFGPSAQPQPWHSRTWSGLALLFRGRRPVSERAARLAGDPSEARA